MRIKYFILLILSSATLLFISCNDNRKISVVDIVSQWEGREILFPENSVFTIQGRDTVDFHFQDAPYKILTYVDSMGCMSCKLQLMNWNKYIQELDSITGGSVPVAFFINAANLKELSYITRRDGFKHPVCFDEKDEINRLNQFSEDMTFQTLLLDRQNKVVAIGNPVHNFRVKELYFDILQGELGKSKAIDRPVLTLEATEIDFGSFSIGEEQVKKLKIVNVGSGMLVIKGITTSCGCTEVEFSSEPLRSGQIAELTLRYNSDEKGYFSKSISIYTNAAEAPYKVDIKGMVE